MPLWASRWGVLVVSARAHRAGDETLFGALCFDRHRAWAFTADVNFFKGDNRAFARLQAAT